MKPARMGWVVESILDQIKRKIKINENISREILLNDRIILGGLSRIAPGQWAEVEVRW